MQAPPFWHGLDKQPFLGFEPFTEQILKNQVNFFN